MSISKVIYSAYRVKDFSGSFDTTWSWYASCCWRYFRLVVDDDNLLLNLLSSLRCWWTILRCAVVVAVEYRSFESLTLFTTFLLLSFAEVSENLVLPLRLIIEAGFRIVQSRTDSRRASTRICRFWSGWSSTQSL